MAVVSTAHQPFLQANQAPSGNRLQKNAVACSPRASTLRVRAAKLPAGVQVPRVQPKLSEPFLGFTNTAEVWNSRACMMGLIGTFIVELILNKGVLEIIGFEVGKGLDIPL
ncbi:light-harvesting complex-like protein OHP1, chloroplastic [Brachypodium distachyon]|uniref:Uncharacterized protein n=1 Tax=Brachypodium distachyon TaxID=15368 RepID=I1IIF5_BRADI|nr:light-harvesting complex-like protein OHP1, chloroplastic [Brachypodium distachyon]KQJ86732.1 hypothetical protein BRADI_4g07440v3 [Brachypodium distachyon]PNT62713.1 hypothetical protein BRADI_4g07440v3 [Brachypodium distachyon]|eukprot:XP_003576368.1 light-harvesting complex-like protein OHP1, chloroplastic [Brachypodium distachyon]